MITLRVSIPYKLRLAKNQGKAHYLELLLLENDKWPNYAHYHSLCQFDSRLFPVKAGFHRDHIIPIRQAWEHRIDPRYVRDHTINGRYLTEAENLAKGTAYSLQDMSKFLDKILAS